MMKAPIAKTPPGTAVADQPVCKKLLDDGLGFRVWGSGFGV